MKNAKPTNVRLGNPSWDQTPCGTIAHAHHLKIRGWSCVSLDSVERINWNEEKDAPKEKINTEIVFTDLKSPP